MESHVVPVANARVAVVTGGNKGIGLEVCRQLAGSGVTVVLTARDEARGAAAADELRATTGLSGVLFHQLDITDAPSVARLAGFLKTRFGKLDILVNNAAIGGVEYAHDPDYCSVTSTEKEKLSGMDRDRRLGWLWENCRETYDTAKEGLRTNYYGTKQVTQALLPLLQATDDGRIVNVSSDFGQLRELKRELNDIDSLTQERLDELLDMFLKDFEAGTVETRGWPMYFSAYKVAKAAMNAYSRILARDHPELRVNCVHPGYVKTDLTIHSGLLTVQEGGSRVAMVALLPASGPTGAFFEDFKESSFV
ncbi:hypothetical protein U9M48_033283 [Paspalum notatum var. saurae]|uniref:(+)-neomenthol dehydrogenase n=1 Tax=Paspalum notatum var. saurae TaxID=547442 RepID=A0AAQ3U6X0_PASNO